MRLFSPRSEERKRTLLRKRAEYAQQPSASAAAVGYGGNGYWPEAEASGSGLPRLVPEGRLSAAALPEGRVLAPPPPLREAPRSPHSPGGRSMAEKLAAGHMLTDDELAAMQEYSAVTAEFENGSLPLVPMMPSGPRTSTPRSLACAQAGEMSRASTSQSARCVGLGEQSRASTSQSARCVGTGATAAWPSPRGGNPYTAHLSPEVARAYEPSPPQQPRRAMTSQSARYVGTGGRNSRSTLSLTQGVLR